VARISRPDGRLDAIVVGGGHNGLVAAALLARAGRSVRVLERRAELGGAAVSDSPWPGVGVRLSRYSYLVSLFPRELLAALGVRVELRRRPVSSYTPAGDGGLLVADGREPSAAWQRFYAMLAGVAARVAPTLTEPLRSRAEIRSLVGDGAAFEGLFETPLSAMLERTFASDLERGVVLTDALIGTFAAAGDPLLRQNRCFLYHVIGDGTGLWKVPVGGMGALSGALAAAARAAGAELAAGSEVVAIATDGAEAEVVCADGALHHARHVLAGVAPDVLAGLLGGRPESCRPEGSQLKLNMLLARLPRLREAGVAPEQAFAGTFHVNESYEQLQAAHDEAAAGRIPTVAPCELYCHSLSDPTVLSPELRAAGAQTLTAFVLHMPARLFASDPEAAKQAALAATLRSIDSVLAEPLEDCLWRTPGGEACLEARTPVELERELRMPGGHIFHRDLTWPFAEGEHEVGRWGAETDHANVWLCGAGARRGGGVSGIPGHNAARAVLAAHP
jgi:phytoene dehydrogenase-like protein